MKLTAVEMGKSRPHEVLGNQPDELEARKWAVITREAAAVVGGYQSLARKVRVARNAPQNWASGRHEPSARYRERLLAIVEEAK